MNCDLCRMHGRSKQANYIIRIDGYDWPACYDCKEEERTKGNSEIIKTLKSPYWLIETQL